jgi:hypothetical protein
MCHVGRSHHDWFYRDDFAESAENDAVELYFEPLRLIGYEEAKVVAIQPADYEVISHPPPIRPIFDRPYQEPPAAVPVAAPSADYGGGGGGFDGGGTQTDGTIAHFPDPIGVAEDQWNDLTNPEEVITGGWGW